MSNQFSPEADDSTPEKKSSQQRLLLLLLLLIAIFAYLYFFTGMIRPRETQPTPQPAPEALVKKPLPPRPASAKATAGKPAPAEVVTAGKPAPAEVATAGKPAPAKVATAAKPAPAPEAKPAKPAATAPQAKAAKPPAPATSAQQATTAQPALPGKGAKSVPAAKPAAQPNGTPKAPAGAKSAEVTPVKPKAAAMPAAHAYALQIEGDLLESEMGSVMAKLKRAGVSQVVKTPSQKGENMHRLFLADFGNRDEALEELERLKATAPDAFMLKENGRYVVYAGSYLREAKASAEQDRLLGKGVKLLMKTASTPVAVVQVRAGSFADQASAEKAAKRLKQGGLPAKVVKVGK